MKWLSLFRRQKKWVKLSVIFVILPLALFIIVSLGVLLYTFVPVDLNVPEIESSPHLTLLAHGVHDTPATWSREMAKLIEEKGYSDRAIALDWSEYADSVLRCSVDGLRYGRELGRKLGHGEDLKTLHLIGHSCGAFVILGVCRGLKAGINENVVVRTTYLDPASPYGGIFQEYGREHFGSCADQSEVYYDRGDGIPGSNEPLPNAKSHDVTSLRKKVGYAGNPHLWPIEYYSRKIRETGWSMIWQPLEEE